jgi:hypothetical protein
MTFNQNLSFKKQKFTKHLKFGDFIWICLGAFDAIYAKNIWQMSKKKTFQIINKTKFHVKQISKFLLLNKTNFKPNKRKISHKVLFLPLLFCIFQNRQICSRNFEI